MTSYVGNPRARVRRALQLVLLTAYLLVAAPAMCQEEAKKLPRSVQVVLYEAQQAFQADQTPKARKLLTDYIAKISKKKDKLHYLVPFTLANSYAMTGASEQALTYYRMAIGCHNGDAGVWQNMGKTYFDLGRYIEAGESLLKAHGLSEEKDDTLIFQAATCYISGQATRKAMPHLERICAGKEDTVPVSWLETLTHVYMELSLNRKGISLIRRVQRTRGEDPRWWKLLANFHLREKAYKAAAAALKIHAEFAELSRQEVELLGDLYHMSGAPAKAAVHYEKILSWKKSAKQFEKLASTYMAAHQPARAADVLSRGLKLHDSARLWRMLGRIHYDMENYGEAYAAFDQSFKLDPKDGNDAMLMGYCAMQEDKKDRAVAAFKKAATFKKQKKNARAVLKEIELIVAKGGGRAQD